MLIKKIILSLTILLFFVFDVSAVSEGNISADSAIVINAQTKEVLFEKNAYKKRSMASTTKIMTSILAIESGKLSCDVTATADAMAEGTSIGLKKDYVLSLESLVYGMLLESGNDAANLCALFLGGSFENFSKMMNEKAKEIGMTGSNFVTPSGLDAEEHYSTAYDMALLGAYCVDNPVFREICSAKSKKITYSKPQISITFYNHNRLLDACEGVFGIKTGFTKKSGRCLVTACERNGATLICVTLKAGDDWNDHKKLYDYCFSDLSEELVKESDISSIIVYGSDKDQLRLKCEEMIYHYKYSDGEITKRIYCPKMLYAPISENDIVGRVEYYRKDDLIGTVNICAAESVYSSEPTYKERFSLYDWIKEKINQLFNREDSDYDRR